MSVLASVLSLHAVGFQHLRRYQIRHIHNGAESSVVHVQLAVAAAAASALWPRLRGFLGSHTGADLDALDILVYYRH